MDYKLYGLSAHHVISEFDNPDPCLTDIWIRVLPVHLSDRTGHHGPPCTDARGGIRSHEQAMISVASPFSSLARPDDSRPMSTTVHMSRTTDLDGQRAHGVSRS